MDAGVIETLVGVGVTIVVGVVTPTLFQMVWGRPRLEHEFCRSQDEENRLFIVLRNPPVRSQILRLIGVVRSPNGIEGDYRVYDQNNQILDSGALWLQLNHAPPAASVQLSDHGWVRIACATQRRFIGAPVNIGVDGEDPETVSLQPDEYKFEVSLDTSAGRKKFIRWFVVEQDNLRWLQWS